MNRAPTVADELATLQRGIERHRKRVAELDVASRQRRLTEAESFELEREILLADGKPLPHGLTRALVRHGIKRDMSRYASGPATPGEVTRPKNRAREWGG